MPDRTCSVVNCERPLRARGWCATHHQRWRTTGSIADPIKAPETCTFPGCGNKHNANGLCYRHRTLQRRGEELRPLVKKVRQRCLIEGCERWSAARGLCGRHSYRLDRHGDPAWEPVRVQWLGRFWANVDKGGPVSVLRPDLGQCWLWTGDLSERGYGLSPSNVARGAHRFGWILLRGEVPAGLELDHLCRVHNCVNPDHLEPVTHAENMRRAAPFYVPPPRLPACPRGHAYTDDNLIRRSGTRAGQHECLTCSRDRSRVRHCATCRALPGQPPLICIHGHWPSRPEGECINGHPYDAENTGSNGGRRRCRRCHRDREAARRRRRLAQIASG